MERKEVVWKRQAEEQGRKMEDSEICEHWRITMKVRDEGEYGASEIWKDRDRARQIGGV